MTSEPAVSSRRTGLRRIAPGVVLIAFIIVGALAGWRFLQSESSRSFPPERAVSWTLYAGFGPTTFNPTTAQTTTVVKVLVGEPECSSRERTFPRDLSWLAPPVVTYTPSAVTIALYTNDVFEAFKTCHGTLNGRRVVGVTLDVYRTVPVQLSQPLRGRALFDGSTDPAAPRPYP